MAEERIKNDEDIATMKRMLCGEQINGNKVIGMYEKVEKMWDQFTFFFRVYKVMMVLILAIVLGIIALVINAYGGVK